MAYLEDMEPMAQAMLDRRAEHRQGPPYCARSTAFVEQALIGFFSSLVPGGTVTGVQRMGGGASKEQFAFTISQGSGIVDRYVLRMDPWGAITESDRGREATILKAMKGVVPVPDPIWLDLRGDYFQQPAMIMNLVPGVTKPPQGTVKVSGLGTWLGDPLRGQLGPQFVDLLARLHAWDWRGADLPGFAVPDSDLQAAARWSLNFWRGLWRIDKLEDRPIMALAEQWLIDNLPACTDLVMTHGDYRTGNYLYDPETVKITAVLDWEMARIGDFHEDLAWVLMQVFGTVEDGLFRASDLYPREEFIAAYEAASGRTVDRRVLHYYEVMASWKCYIVTGANGLAVARAAHNHQDVLQTFLGASSAMFAADLCRLLEQGGVK